MRLVAPAVTAPSAERVIAFAADLVSLCHDPACRSERNEFSTAQKNICGKHTRSSFEKGHKNSSFISVWTASFVTAPAREIFVKLPTTRLRGFGGAWAC